MMRLGDITGSEPASLRDGRPGPPRELYRRIATAKKALADGKHEGSLVGDSCADDLRVLTDIIGSLVPVSCDNGSLGYLNPQHAFNLKHRCGLPNDYVSAAALKSAAAELSRLWGDDMCVTGTDLARNAILLAVLEDPALREPAVKRARAWLDGLSNQIEVSGLNLV